LEGQSASYNAHYALDTKFLLSLGGRTKLWALARREQAGTGLSISQDYLGKLPFGSQYLFTTQSISDAVSTKLT